MISFLETIKGNDPVFFIHALCGIGDITSHLARLPSVEKVYPNHKIVFLLGGYGKSPKLSKEMIERQGYAATTIKNYIYHNQHQKMETSLFFQNHHLHILQNFYQAQVS